MSSMSITEESTFLATQRYAVVTGANKGIGLEICKQLASNGVMVVLTARDENRGIEALEKLKAFGLSDHLNFHQLDVVDPSSISSLVDFVNTQFGKLDILVNNAGISGVIMDSNASRASAVDKQPADIHWSWSELTTQTYSSAEECIETNYYGAKRMIEAFVPLLRLSDSPRIVNVSSSAGKLKFITNEWANGILSDDENLTEEKIDEIFSVYLKDFKEDCLEAECWPPLLSAYKLSKAAMNAYTRMLGKKYPNFLINSVCPGFVKTDINYCTGYLTVEEGAQSAVRLALLPKGGHSGLFFFKSEVSPI